MGSEIRMVPKGYEHPKNEAGRYIPLYYSNFLDELTEWRKGEAQWEKGFKDDWMGGWKPLDGSEDSNNFTEWHGEKPDIMDYMNIPNCQAKTHLMMYEITSEGTPISPSFETPEELANWLTDNEASSFGSSNATYEHWLRVCLKGYAPTAIISGGIMKSGVEGLRDE